MCFLLCVSIQTHYYYRRLLCSLCVVWLILTWTNKQAKQNKKKSCRKNRDDPEEMSVTDNGYIHFFRFFLFREYIPGKMKFLWLFFMFCFFTGQKQWPTNNRHSTDDNDDDDNDRKTKQNEKKIIIIFKIIWVSLVDNYKQQQQQQ